MAESRWLSDEEQRAWRAFLLATRRVFDELDHQLQRDAGIPHAYYEVLVRLSEAPGRTLRMRELAERSMSSPSRLSHAVTRMEDAGWVRRDECATDRRGTFATLTDEGHTVLTEAAPGHAAQVRRLVIDPLTPAQVDQLRQACELVAEQAGVEERADPARRHRI